MKQRQWGRLVKRDRWRAHNGKEPWKGEPDKEQWTYKGYPCLIVRTRVTGALCGYVGVTARHPYYHRSASELDADTTPVSVHGGVTYMGFDSGNIYSVLEQTDTWKDIWWIGFDCSHLGDYSPNLQMDSEFKEHYWTLQEVRGEVERLADQLQEAANG